MRATWMCAGGRWGQSQMTRWWKARATQGESGRRLPLERECCRVIELIPAQRARLLDEHQGGRHLPGTGVRRATGSRWRVHSTPSESVTVVAVLSSRKLVDMQCSVRLFYAF